MKLKNIVSSLALAAMVVTSHAALADPVYMIAQIGVADQDKFFNQYSAAAFPSLMENGAKILVATPTHQKLEGEWSGNWTVIIEFASQEDADSWYTSEDYQTNAIPIRQASTDFGNMIIVPGFVQPSQ